MLHENCACVLGYRRERGSAGTEQLVQVPSVHIQCHVYYVNCDAGLAPGQVLAGPVSSARKSEQHGVVQYLFQTS